MRKIFDTEIFAKIARRAVAEGVVLLENNNDILPIKDGANIALFGRSQYNYYKSGTGSGGMVNTAYVIGVKEAIEADDRFNLNAKLKARYDEWIISNPFDAGVGWASEPWFQKEMDITEDIAKEAAAESDLAIILIGRSAGEDQDNKNEKGSYLLTDAEELMLRNVCSAFDKTVVLINSGNIIDMKWVKKYKPSAVAYIWQGGQEGGNGAWDVITGAVNPAGRLTDTIAENIEDYPSTENFGDESRNIYKEDIYVGYRYFETFAKEKVLYPFGFGLSYTSFSINTLAFDINEERAKFTVEVTNTGNLTGQQVVQVYLEKPVGKLGQPARVLVGFSKTREIEPNNKEELIIEIPTYYMASYDDSGVTGHKSAYVLEAGDYNFYVGDSVRNTDLAASFSLQDTVVIEQLSEALAPRVPFDRIKSDFSDGKYIKAKESAPVYSISPSQHRDAELQEEISQTKDKGIKLVDVVDGKANMEDFIAELTDDELVCIVRGEGMSSPKVTPGTGGAFGGVIDSLVEKGIPVACCSDGPSGIRMDSGKKAFAMPNGTCLASTWNLKLQEQLYQWEGLELRKNKIDVLLGPGMNIHRNPLNGRNFEYFSEDPLVTGKSAVAQLKGMHKYNVTGTIKHFALNNQETARYNVDSVASERAIREIYLKGFEIAVKEGNASAVMSAYNPLNGIYTSSNYDLITKILRQEWGFSGIVMTDWWAKGSDDDGKGDPSNMAAIVRAQNDLYMVCNDAESNSNKDNSKEALAKGVVTRGEYQRCAMNIVKFITEKPVFFRFTNRGNELDNELLNEVDDDEDSFDSTIDLKFDDANNSPIDVSLIETGRNKTTLISVAVRERGNYRLSMTVRANAASDLAQIPLTIFRDTAMVKMVTLSGEDRDWQTINVDFEGCIGAFYIKLYFAQDGMEIKEASVSMVESLEEEIRKQLSHVD